jgi:hypothetical protein
MFHTKWLEKDAVISIQQASFKSIVYNIIGVLKLALVHNGNYSIYMKHKYVMFVMDTYAQLFLFCHAMHYSVATICYHIQQ